MDAQSPVVSPGTPPVYPPPRSAPSRGALWSVIAILGLAIFTGFAAWHFHTPSREQLVSEAATAFDAGDLDSALSVIDRGLAAYPKDVQLLILKSLALSQKGSTTFQEALYGNQAVAIAQKAIALDPNSSEAYRALGYANEIQGKYTEAHAAYKQAILLDPKNAMAIFDQGHTYDLEGNADKAKTYYNLALGADKTLYTAYIGLGRIAAAAGDFKNAFNFFQIVYNSSKNTNERSQASYSMGMILIKQQNTDLARGYLQKATELDPNYPSAWFGLGVALYQQSIASSSASAHTSGALMISSINDLNKALTMDPNLALAAMQISQDYFLIGQPQVALSELSYAKTLVPKDITLSATDKKALVEQIDSMSAFIQKTQAAIKKP